MLPNPDMIELSATVAVGMTPVIISEQLKFVTPARAEADRAAANRLLEAWRADLETTDSTRLRAHYSQHFKAMRGQNLDAWMTRIQAANLGARQIAVSLRDVSLFRYPEQKGQKEMIVAAFTQEAVIGKGRHVTRKRQYWAQEGGQWKIVSEANIQ